jgi:hypothetical protein
MEQDKQLKEVLSHGTEIASADFTEGIMKRIQNLSVHAAYYQPLVSIKMKRAFILIFGILVLLILLVCLTIGSPALPLVSTIKVPELSMYTCYKIFGFIFSFWFVFITNSFVEKSKMKLY